MERGSRERWVLQLPIYIDREREVMVEGLERESPERCFGGNVG